MKRLCIVIEVPDERPDLLLTAVAINAATQAGGELRSAYIDAVQRQNGLDRFFGVERTTSRNELFPPHLEHSGSALLERKHA